jgi:hypothetical protein
MQVMQLDGATRTIVRRNHRGAVHGASWPCRVTLLCGWTVQVVLADY